MVGFLICIIFFVNQLLKLDNSFRCNKKISSSYLKPDYTIKVEGTDEKHTELFIIEVKAPMRNRSSYDFIKTALTMKDMLDKLIRKGVENPIVTGLLINGK